MQKAKKRNQFQKSFVSKNTAGGRNSQKAVKKKTSRCPVSTRCGGCTMIDVPYDAQLQQKQERIDQLLAPFGSVQPIIRMKNPNHYRNKVTAIFGYDFRGRAACGTYQAGTHNLVDIKSCLIEDAHADRIVQSIRALLPSFRIRHYNEDTGEGLLRYVQIRMAHRTHQIMVTLVVTTPVWPARKSFVRALMKEHPEITTIVMNINDKRTTMVLGEREEVLYGNGYIEDELCGKRFRISSRSFYQVNSIQTEKLYNIAVDCAGLSGKETVLDTYCGIGTIGIIASGRAKRVLSVELNEDACEDARYNAALNGASGVEVFEGDSGDFMLDMAQREEKADVVFLDPPRSGASETFIDAMAQMEPGKIVYVSCDPDTLARDLALITQKGYFMKKAVPVDMFPYTGKIETIVQLCRKNS